MRVPTSRRRAALVLTGGLFVLSLILFLGLRSERPPVRDVAFSDILRLVAADDVKTLEVEGDTLTTTRKGGERVRATAIGAASLWWPQAPEPSMKDSQLP